MKKKLAQTIETLDLSVEEASGSEEQITAPERKSFFFNDDSNAPYRRSPNEEIKPKIKRSNRNLYYLGGGVFMATILLTTLFGLLFLNGPKSNIKSDTKSDKIESIETTPTPKPVILNRKNWSFEVLNGSGVAGVAKKASDKLEELGYKVLKTGNAEENVSSTQLFVAKDKSEDEVKLLINDLKSDFGKLTVTGTLSDSEASVRLILSN